MAKQVHIHAHKRLERCAVIEMDDGALTRGFYVRDEQDAFALAAKWNVRCRFAGDIDFSNAEEMAQEELREFLTTAHGGSRKSEWKYIGTVGRLADDDHRARMFAARSAMGTTTQQIADRFDVALKSVRRWEKPGTKAALAPDNVQELIGDSYFRALKQAEQICVDAIEGLVYMEGHLNPARLPQYRSQEHYDAVLAASGRDDETREGFEFENAVSRFAAAMLFREGIPFEFYYPTGHDECECVLWNDGIVYIKYLVEKHRVDKGVWGVWAQPAAASDAIWRHNSELAAHPPLYYCESRELAFEKMREIASANKEMVDDYYLSVFAASFDHGCGVYNSWEIDR